MKTPATSKRDHKIKVAVDTHTREYIVTKLKGGYNVCPTPLQMDCIMNLLMEYRMASMRPKPRLRKKHPLAKAIEKEKLALEELRDIYRGEQDILASIPKRGISENVDEDGVMRINPGSIFELNTPDRLTLCCPSWDHRIDMMVKAIDQQIWHIDWFMKAQRFEAQPTIEATFKWFDGHVLTVTAANPKSGHVLHPHGEEFITYLLGLAVEDFAKGTLNKQQVAQAIQDFISWSFQLDDHCQKDDQKAWNNILARIGRTQQRVDKGSIIIEITPSP